MSQQKYSRKFLIKKKKIKANQVYPLVNGTIFSATIQNTLIRGNAQLSAIFKSYNQFLGESTISSDGS